MAERQAREWRFLQLLCNTNLPEPARTEFCTTLPAEAFSDVLHRVAFEEIRGLTTRAAHGSSAALREHLRTRLTARGFPDVDFENLLSCADQQTDDALDLVAQLRSARALLSADTTGAS
jgi:hypothetical protein